MHVQDASAQKRTDYVNQVMAGISNNGQNKNKPYLTAGDRTYIVGTAGWKFP